MPITKGSRVRWSHPHLPSAVVVLGFVYEVLNSGWLVVDWDNGELRAHPWSYVERDWIVESEDQLQLFGGA